MRVNSLTLQNQTPINALQLRAYTWGLMKKLRMPRITWHTTHEYNTKEKWQAGCGIIFIQYVNGNTKMSGMDEWRWRPNASQLKYIYWLKHFQIQDNCEMWNLIFFPFMRILVYPSTHQFPFLHALHNHEQDLLRLAFGIIESLLYGHQKLVSDIIINQAVGGDAKKTFNFFFWRNANSKEEIIWNLTLHPLRTCVRRKLYQKRDRCHHTPPQEQEAHLSDSLGRWR